MQDGRQMQLRKISFVVLTFRAISNRASNNKPSSSVTRFILVIETIRRSTVALECLLRNKATFEACESETTIEVLFSILSSVVIASFLSKHSVHFRFPFSSVVCLDIFKISEIGTITILTK